MGTETDGSNLFSVTSSPLEMSEQSEQNEKWVYIIINFTFKSYDLVRVKLCLVFVVYLLIAELMLNHQRY